jgi:hypothetical protein
MGDKSPKNTSKTKKQKAQKKAAGVTEASAEEIAPLLRSAQSVLRGGRSEASELMAFARSTVTFRSRTPLKRPTGRRFVRADRNKQKPPVGLFRELPIGDYAPTGPQPASGAAHCPPIGTYPQWIPTV